jgi:nucleotide-binding universal stress UspA family protein
MQVTCELVVVVGDPREEIPDFIAKHPVDMVVVGSRGLGTVSR